MAKCQILLENFQLKKTAQYTYTFAGWEPEITEAKADVSYTAKFNSIVNSYNVKFLDEDETTELKSESLEYGATPVAPADPAKAATAQYTYSFDGWDKEISEVQGDQTYIAKYSSTLNKYTVRWFYSDGETLLETDANIPYGTKPSFDGEEPKKAKTAEITYTFDGWTSNGVDVYTEENLPEITGNIDYVAHFAESATKYTVKFLNTAGDAVIQTIENVDYGVDVTDQFEGDLPSKDSTFMEIEFDHWKEDVDTENYIRTYSPVFRDVVSKDGCFNFIEYGDGYMLYSVTEMYDYPTLILPSTYNSKPVLAVYEGCFNWWAGGRISSNVKKIIIPSSYTLLQTESFCWTRAEEIIFEGSPNISSGAFHSSKYLKNVEFRGTNPYTLTYNVFEACGANDGFEVTFSEGLTSISQACFRGSKLTKVNIPNSVTMIDSYAFSTCSMLEEVTFGDNPSFEEIGEGAFLNNTALKSFEIPNTVTKIGNSAFYGSGLEEAVIPDSVATIGTSIFSQANLKRITLGKYVTVNHIATKYLIEDCPIEEFIVSEENEELSSVEGYLFNKAGTQLVRCPAALQGEITLPSQTTSIAQNAFAGTKELTKVNINEGVTIIPTECFAGSSAKEVVLSSTVTQIAMYAFRNSELEKIHIGQNVNSIHNTAFSGCPSITEVTVDANNNSFVCEDLVLFNKSKTILKLCVKSKTGSYTIPNTVTEVANSAFLGCELNVTVPNSVNYFGDLAFSEFKGTVTLGNGIDKIYSSMFKKADIQTITLPETIKTIDSSAFYQSKIESIELPDACTTIGQQAFYKCESLTSIDLNKVQTIGGWSFSGCTSLEEIEIPNTMVSCEAYAFYMSGLKDVTWNGADVPQACFGYCSSLESITFSSKNTEIGVEAFTYCSKLKTVVFSTSLETIKQSAFYYCSLYEDINLPVSIKTIAVNAFVGVKATEINYAGTTTNWSSVSCAGGWKGSALNTLHCSDDTISI